MKAITLTLIAYATLILSLVKSTVIFMSLGGNKELLTAVSLVFAGLITVGAGILLARIISEINDVPTKIDSWQDGYNKGYKTARGY